MMKHGMIFINLLMISLGAYSQNRETVTVKKYTQKNGLSSYNIRKITEDKAGFLWVATQDGLNRFDGRSFVNYTKSANQIHRLCGVDIRDFIEDTLRNLLWVLPGEVGINAINTVTGNVMLTIPIPYISNEDWNVCMIMDNDCLWIGTFTGLKIYNINENKFEQTQLGPKKTANPVECEVKSILKDEYGNIWVCYSGFGI